MKKWLLTIFLVCCVSNVMAYNIVRDGIYYNIDRSNMTAVVTGKSSYGATKTYSGNVVVPEIVWHDDLAMIDAFTVVGIDEYAFYDCDELLSVALPNTIKRIGNYAFLGCI